MKIWLPWQRPLNIEVRYFKSVTRILHYSSSQLKVGCIQLQLYPILCNIGSQIQNLVTMATSPENLSSIFEIPNSEKPTVEAKIFSISPTEVMLCPFKVYCIDLHCGYREFSRFLRKIVEIIIFFLNQTPKGMQYHRQRSRAALY